MVHAAFASMIMYHDARVAAGEMGEVTVAMHEAFKGRATGVAVTTFSEWGTIIRTRFDTDNLHLSMGGKAVDSGTAAMVRALGRSLSEVKGELATIRKCLIEGGRGASTPARGALTPDCTAASPNPLDAVEPSPTPAAVIAAGSSAFGSLMPQVGGAAPTPAAVSWAGSSAGYYYRNVKVRGGAIDAGLGKQDKKDAQDLVKFFDAMATADEKVILGRRGASQPPADEGERRTIAERLQKLMVARFAKGFTDAGESVPMNLGKGLLPTSGIANRQKELKPKGIKLDPSTFAQWRKEREAAEESASASEAPHSAGNKRARS